MKNRTKDIYQTIPEGCNRTSQPCKDKEAETTDRDFPRWLAAKTPDKNTRGWLNTIRSIRIRTIHDVGFTLIELLVVVLIIGILAAIAVPQYQRSVDKARVATVLPLMRSWIDALALYKLEHGSYEGATAITTGVSWPGNWETYTNGLEGLNELWGCFSNEEITGEVLCEVRWKTEQNNSPFIFMTQPDDPREPAGKRMCLAGPNGSNYFESFCRSLGGNKIEGYNNYYEF